MVEQVAILGAGIAGLSAAMALAGPDRDIVILEKDPALPAGGPEEAFETWARRGVGHLRHSHAFLARLRSLIRLEHPDLLEALRAAGARELTFAEGLPAPLRERYVAHPGDEELAVIVSRRTTLEMVIRRYVEGLPGVALRSGVFASGLLVDAAPEGRPRVGGFKTAEGAVEAEVVIDAGGWRSPVADWLAEAGVEIAQQSEDCAILYYTRFYRLNEGQSEPPRGRFPTTGDLGYLKFAVFPADNGTFSITLAAPEVEETLRAAVTRPEVFDAICQALPGLAAWVGVERSAPVSRVFGMGNLKSQWRDMAPGGRAAAAGLFCVGDSLVRTNPLYGRGCSFAAVEAHILRDVLADSGDPDERAKLYDQRVGSELRAFYDDMATQDRSAARRALNGLDPSYRPSWRSRLLRAFLEDGVAIAVRRDADLLRSAMRAFHMFDPPRDWLGRPRTLAKVLAVWARGRRANAAYYAEKPGPERRALFALLGLDAEADMRRPIAVTPVAPASSAAHSAAGG